MNHQSVARFLAFALALVCALSGCAKNPDERAAASSSAASAPKTALAPELGVVRFGYQKIGAPFLLKSRSESLDQRLSERGLKAEWREFKAGPTLLEAINAREVDIGYVGETPPVFAQAGGVPFVYVATDPPAPKAEAIIVRKDSPIRKVSELRGKRVALNRGSNVHYLLLKALEREKLGVRDVQVTYLAPGDARPAFETGQVDAWVIWDPFLAAAEQSGARVLANGEGLVDNHLFYVARREFAEKSPDVVRLALDEYQALSEWEAKNAEEAAKILARSSGVTYEALLLSEQRHTYGILPITPEILQKQQAIADAFKALELIPKQIRPADAFIPALTYAQKAP